MPKSFMTSTPGRNVGRTVRPSGRLERARKTGTSGYKPGAVKNLFGVQDILFPVLRCLLTSLIYNTDPCGQDFALFESRQLPTRIDL
jgi:hypothetical protein